MKACRDCLSLRVLIDVVDILLQLVAVLERLHVQALLGVELAVVTRAEQELSL